MFFLCCRVSSYTPQRLLGVLISGWRGIHPSPLVAYMALSNETSSVLEGNFGVPSAYFIGLLNGLLFGELLGMDF